jgi:hypothetical protein
MGVSEGSNFTIIGVPEGSNYTINGRSRWLKLHDKLAFQRSQTSQYLAFQRAQTS